MSTAAVPAPETERNSALDGLRGYAAVAVVFYHTILGPVPHIVPTLVKQGVQSQDTAYHVLLKLVLSLLSGEVAVSVFFVISGIVLFRALRVMHGRAVAEGNGQFSAALGTSWRFLLRRILRIWPVMAACLVAKTVLFQQVDAAWPGFVPAPTAEDLVVNLALVGFPVHGATWTLLVELAAAPFLLACFLAVARFGPWLAVAFLVYAVLSYKYNFLLLYSPMLITGLPFLLAGAAVECGWLAPLMRSRLRGPVAALAAAALLADMLFVPFAWFKLHTGVMLLSIAVLVGWVHAAHDGPVGRFLQARPSRYLGRISFSLYLWNVPVFELMLNALGQDRISRMGVLEAGLLVGAAATVVTIPIAHLSERWLEQPCIRLGRQLTGRSGGRPWKAFGEPGKIAPHASAG